MASAVPDQNDDGVFDVASSALRNDLSLVDGATGETIWGVWLESKDLPFNQRPGGRPVVYVPATEETPA